MCDVQWDKPIYLVCKNKFILLKQKLQRLLARTEITGSPSKYNLEQGWYSIMGVGYSIKQTKHCTMYGKI